MGKRYNISSSSDMRKFSRDLERSVMDMARNAVYDQSFSNECPHCKSTFNASSGMNICPFCRNQVDLKLNIKF